jgi:hypothetical protein
MDPLNYQSPGAHQKSQWVTDAQPGGNWMVAALIIASVVGTILAGIGTLMSWYLGWW